MKLSRAAALTAALTITSPALAQSFGSAKTIMPAGGVTFSFQNISPPAGEAQTITRLSIAPMVMYFLIDNLAVGGALRVQHIGGDTVPFTSYGISPAVGYNLAVNEAMSVFPYLSIPFLLGNTEFSSGQETVDASTLGLGMRLDAPFLVHFQNFFVGIGPFFQIDLVSQITIDSGDSVDGNKAMLVGVTTVIGGWI